MKKIINYVNTIKNKRKISKFLYNYRNSLTKERYKQLYDSFLKMKYIVDFENEKNRRIILPSDETVNKIVSIIDEYTQKQFGFDRIKTLEKLNNTLISDYNKIIKENDNLKNKIKEIRKNV